jgi:glycosyltransferase involved in cell wall biosynthesis
VVHGKGGGTIRYAVNVATVAGQRFDTLFAWGIDNRELVLSSVSPDVPEVTLLLPSGLDVAVAAMKRRNVVRADVIHFKGLDMYIDQLLELLRVPFDLTLVDFHSVARSPHLRDKQGRYIGDQVLSDLGHPMRRNSAPLLRKAERRIAISRDTAGRFQKMVPDLSFIAARIPEPLNPQDVAVHFPPVDPDMPLRVLVLGAFTPHKGSQTVLEVARKASEAAVPIEFHVLGVVPKPPDAISQRNVYLYGPYRANSLTELICTIRPNLAWMPFSVPETHSFTLSDVMRHGLPILTVGLGAIAERLEGREKTWVLEPTSASPDAYLDWLLRLRRARLQIASTCPSTSHLPPLSELFYETAYLAQN